MIACGMPGCRKGATESVTVAAPDREHVVFAFCAQHAAQLLGAYHQWAARERLAPKRARPEGVTR